MQSFWIGFGPRRPFYKQKYNLPRSIFVRMANTHMYPDIFDLATLKSKAKYILYQKKPVI